jgi:hypothetical protein
LRFQSIFSISLDEMSLVSGSVDFRLTPLTAKVASHLAFGTPSPMQDSPTPQPTASMQGQGSLSLQTGRATTSRITETSRAAELRRSTRRTGGGPSDVPIVCSFICNNNLQTYIYRNFLWFFSFLFFSFLFLGASQSNYSSKDKWTAENNSFNRSCLKATNKTYWHWCNSTHRTNHDN